MITHNRFFRKSIAMSIALAMLGAAALAASDPSSAPPVGAKDHANMEMRDKMAAAHEKMAACLRSNRPIADCRGELMQACRGMNEPMCGMGMDTPSHAMKDMAPKKGTDAK